MEPRSCPTIEIRSLDAELVADKVVKVAGHCPFVVAITGLAGGASASVVGHNDLVAGRHQGWHDFAPRVPSLRRTVDQKNRLRRARRDAGEGVADPNANSPVDPGATASHLGAGGVAFGTDRVGHLSILSLVTSRRELSAVRAV